MELRDYQRQSVDAVWRHLRTRRDNPCLVLPTGAGKSVVLAALCRTAVREWSGRVLVLAHVKELLEQIVNHLVAADPSLPVGIYSAGLGQKDAGYAVTVAGIQSAANNPELFSPDLVIVDECHRIPPDGEGQYRTLLESIAQRVPHVRLVGLTATPYRLKSGALCRPDGLLNKICFEVGIRELIAKNYLTLVHSYGPAVEDDFSAIPKVAGEFNQGNLEAHMSDDAKVLLAIGDMITRAAGRKSCLVFASGVEHGHKIAALMRDAGEVVGEVYGETDSEDRTKTVKAFRSGAIRWLVNCDVLTLGFDAPNVDCVVLLRATLSPGLYYQMVGRGFRIADGKADCLLLDYGGNVLRHGLVDELKIDERAAAGNDGAKKARKCPKCLAYATIKARMCETCGTEFQPPEDRLRRPAYDDVYKGRVVGDGETRKPEWVEASAVRYSLHSKEKPDGTISRTLRVTYGTYDAISEFVCLEHTGYARNKAEAWWARRFGSDEFAPCTVDGALDAIDIAETDGSMKKPAWILVGWEGKYRRVLDVRFVGEPSPEAKA